jgi:hypothetical protein
MLIKIPPLAQDHLPFEVLFDVAKEVADSCHLVMGCAIPVLLDMASPHKPTRPTQRVFVRRERRSVEEIYKNLGASYFCRYYQMPYETFLELHDKTKAGILKAEAQTLTTNQSGRWKQQHRFGQGSNSSGRGRGNFNTKSGCGNYRKPPVPNGDISTTVRLACAIQYFAGG